MATELPPCGLYRTNGFPGIEPNRLVYFHNHGNPGAGIYFPDRWIGNRAVWQPQGQTVPEVFNAKWLKPLLAEGFYRVSKPFFCCEKKCTQFEPDQMLQLGYNGNGAGILFIPEYSNGVIRVPERGSVVDDAAFANLVALKLPELEARNDLSLPRGIVVH